MDRGSEHTLNSLLVGRKLLVRRARWQIMHGNCINMQSDTWLPQNDPGYLRPTCRVPQHAPTVVAELMDRHNHTWDLSKIKAFISPLDAQAIMEIPISNSNIPDRLIWPHTMNGRLRLKDDRNHFNNPPSESHLWVNPPAECHAIRSGLKLVHVRGFTNAIVEADSKLQSPLSGGHGLLELRTMQLTGWLRKQEGGCAVRLGSFDLQLP
ncbi:PREDICTED: reverse mRNAase [Prunus dulcis]|uniref:PREDICTED: reverse mRNAase n=1 Tax=Prunus dulcis TaxID=3755 RepID=A0A5E4GK45_PRUDU|nr:PREDICTED: reverse mRNAase [Prunus dulcis]